MHTDGRRCDSWDYGQAWAEWLHNECGEDISAVNVEEQIHGITSIPTEDEVDMIRNGITPDARNYWDGYNAWIADNTQ